jgi:hypothetical protein
MNHYDALEVSPNASPEVIRAAYKSLMQRFHPDKNPGDEALAARSAAIAMAYHVLSDEQGRAEYNLSLEAAASQEAMAAQAQASRAARRPASPAVPATGFARHIGFWALVFVVALAGFWSFKALTSKPQPRAELVSIRQALGSASTAEARKRELYSRKLAILEQHPELVRDASTERYDDMATRTFSLLETRLVVRIGDGGNTAELALPSISLLVGTFDAPDHLAHMARHRDRLIRDLSARLARENPDRLARPDGEAHLKRVVREAIAASLGTNPAQDYPSTWFESPGRHGVVDVLLPDRFGLIQLSSLR